jgi:hypothetical protein
MRLSSRTCSPRTCSTDECHLWIQYDVKQRYLIHRERVRSSRPVVKTAPPEDFLHFHYNAKRCMQQAERLFDIERVGSATLLCAAHHLPEGVP